MCPSITRNLLMTALVVAVFSIVNNAHAQGTSTGPLTFHSVQPGVPPFVLISPVGNPFPIDLDPLGPPWTKHIDDPLGLMFNGGIMELREAIRNVGTEPWYDWHEYILPKPTGVSPYPGAWLNVVMAINGNPITFNATGLGGPNLSLDTFSQPVMPGDILTIRKRIDVYGNTSGVPGFLMEIQEYPTPEPTSAALIGIGSLLVMAGRKAARG